MPANSLAPRDTTGQLHRACPWSYHSAVCRCQFPVDRQILTGVWKERATYGSPLPRSPADKAYLLLQKGGWRVSTILYCFIPTKWKKGPPCSANVRSGVSPSAYHHAAGTNQKLTTKVYFLLITCPLYVTCISACHLHSGAQRNRVASVWNVTTACGRGKGNVPEQILSPPTAAQRRHVLFPSTGSGQNKSPGQV